MSSSPRCLILALLTLCAPLALSLSPAGGGAWACEEPAGALFDQSHAADVCPEVCAPWGGWEGTWVEVEAGRVGHCVCNAPAEQPAGPLWSEQMARDRCPEVCADLGGWEGAWRETIPDRMAVCECRLCLH